MTAQVSTDPCIIFHVKGIFTLSLILVAAVGKSRDMNIARASLMSSIIYFLLPHYFEEPFSRR